MNYGPDGSWDEVYFMYSAQWFELLNNSGVFNPGYPVRNLSGFHELKFLLNEIKQLFKSSASIFPADHLDLLCWQTISGSIISSTPESMQTKAELTIRKIAAVMKANPFEEYDFKRVASQNAMALSTFRHYWQRYMATSPGRFLADLKISEACRLLSETDLTISQIAAHINFDDPLYFSRFFQEEDRLVRYRIS